MNNEAYWREQSEMWRRTVEATERDLREARNGHRALEISLNEMRNEAIYWEQMYKNAISPNPKE